MVSCDIVTTFRVLKKGIDVQFNLGSELDFGPGFYITPDFEQARKFINKQVEVLNRSTSNNNIFDSEEEVGIIVEFRIESSIMKLATQPS